MSHRHSREPLPAFVPPMLLRPGPPLDAEGWASEVKWDGMRAQLRLTDGKLGLRSRHDRDWTAAFPELEPLAAKASCNQLLIDAELVCFDDAGHPCFGRLRSRLAQRPSARVYPATLMIFDLLHLDGHSMRCLPYWRRRELLDELALEGSAWRTPRTFTDVEERSRLRAATDALGLEGVVIKHLESTYQPGRRSSRWTKNKHRRRERLVITGWVPGGAGELDSFLVARAGGDGPPGPAGRVRFGLGSARRAALRAALTNLEGSVHGNVRRVDPRINVVVDHSGRIGGPIRDGVIRESNHSVNA